MSIVGFAGDVGYVAVPAAVALETIGVPVPAETTLVAYGLGSAGAGAAWRRVRQGDPAWLFAAGLAEILPYAG